MLDATPQSERPGRDHIILIGTDGSYWLLQGEAHLSALLANDAPYPMPVFCVCFEDMNSLGEFLGPEGPDPQTLWGIHPAIIARLDRAGALRRMTAS